MSDRLKEISKRAEKATKGPWYQDMNGIIVQEGSPFEIREDGIEYGLARTGWLTDGIHRLENSDNGDFIANAREDIPYLLDRLKDAEECMNKMAYHARLNTSELTQYEKYWEKYK